MRRMKYMRDRIILFGMFLVPLGAVVSAHISALYSVPVGLTCKSDKVVSFGFTHKQIAFAEMAAIITWQKRAEKNNPGYGSWPLAQKRNMKCRLYRRSAHYQCQVSAWPCRADKT